MASQFIHGSRFSTPGCDALHSRSANFRSWDSDGGTVHRVKLRMLELAFLFTLGAAASLIGDHSHVATGTTEYFTDAVPFIWSSPICFPLLDE
jgi:hypothetical protein